MDVGFFFGSGEAYSKAADDVYEYIMVRTAKTLEIAQEVAYSRFDEILKTDVYALAFDGKIDMTMDGYHEVMKRISKEYGFVYERKRLGDGK